MTHKIKKITIFLLKIHDGLCDGCYHAAAWMMLALALIISYEVLARYFFNRPTLWAADFTDYIMLYSTFFVSAWLLKRQGHINLTIWTDKLSPRAKLVSNTINSLIGAIVCGFVIWYGARDTWDAIAKNMWLARPVPVPKFFVLGVIPFGFVLLFVQFLRDAFKHLGELRAGSKEEKGPVRGNK